MESVLAAGLLPVDMLIQTPACERPPVIDYENVLPECAMFETWGLSAEMDDEEPED